MLKLLTENMNTSKNALVVSARQYLGRYRRVFPTILSPISNTQKNRTYPTLNLERLMEKTGDMY